MAKRNEPEENEDRPDDLTAFESKLVRLLALLLIQERPQGKQIDLLNRAGFSSAQIAALLGTTRNTVSVALSIQKHSKKSKKKAKKN